MSKGFSLWNETCAVRRQFKQAISRIRVITAVFLLPGAERRHFGAVPADRSAAKTPVVRFRAIVKPENTLLAGALADEVEVDIGQQISDGLGNGSEELFRGTRQIRPLDP